MSGTGRCEARGVWLAVFGGWWVACGVRHVAGGMRHMIAEIMTSVDIIV